jgi:hypothetical protein
MTGKSSKNGKRAVPEIPEGQAVADAGQLARQTGAIRKPDPQRMRILRSLPVHIKQSLTRDEVNAILYESTWPDTLLQKLKDFLVEENAN